MSLRPRPAAEAPWRHALVTIMQFIEGLSNLMAAGIDWAAKKAICPEKQTSSS